MTQAWTLLGALILFGLIIGYAVIVPVRRSDAYKWYRRLPEEEREVFLNWCTMRDFNPFTDATVDEWERVRDKYGFGTRKGKGNWHGISETDSRYNTVCVSEEHNLDRSVLHFDDLDKR